MALIGAYDKPDKKEKPKKKKQDKDKPVKKDTWIESEHLRPLAADTAKERAFKAFDIYKKAHKMVSFT